MHRLSIFAAPLLVLSLAACGDDDVTSPDLAGRDLAGTPVADLSNTNPGDMAGIPAAPTLGMQIDRMGRAGVNTALTDPFWDDGVQTSAAHKAKLDAYNASSDPAAWAALKLSTASGAASVVDLLKGALGTFDALSGTSDGVAGAADGCGDQLAYGALSMPRYTTLAGVLADDQIYVNAASGTCSTYLAVEANVLGVTNTDCGGRTPNYNTIDITYSALASAAIVTAAGCLTSSTSMPCGVSNGVTSDPDTANVASVTTFPFLGGAN